MVGGASPAPRSAIATSEARLQLTRTEQRFTRGDADRLDRVLALTRLLEADIRLLQARTRTLASRLALEDAMQRPLAAGAATEGQP